MIENLKSALDALSDKELQEIADKVEAKNIGGPTVEEYFDDLQEQLNPNNLLSSQPKNMTLIKKIKTWITHLLKGSSI